MKRGGKSKSVLSQNQEDAGTRLRLGRSLSGLTVNKLRRYEEKSKRAEQAPPLQGEWVWLARM